MIDAPLPEGMHVFERGWLSSNNILFVGAQSAALVDSGYGSHSAQTVELVSAFLNERPLDVLLNTHLHSDHCGGNAALQEAYTELKTLIPPGQSSFVSPWDPVSLTYAPTGQFCAPFKFDGVLPAGSEIQLGSCLWQIHAAPGHDPHSIILFEPASKTLISADALWEKGFGVVFPELEGERAFEEVGATLDLIERLAPRHVIPGHGAMFNYRTDVLVHARQRLNAFISNPARHAHHAAKVLLKFKLLEQQHLAFADFSKWATGTAYFQLIRERFFPFVQMEGWIEQLTEELVHSAVASRHGVMIHNA